MEQRELIYSKRFPIFPSSLILDGKEIPEEEPIVETEGAHGSMSLKNFWKRYNEERVYVVKPERIKAVEQFIHLAIDFCDIYQVDVDIWKRSFCVEVALHLSTCSYTRDFTRRFSQLVNLCDRMGTFLLRNGPGEFTVTLEYDTHDFYVAGRLINK